MAESEISRLQTTFARFGLDNDQTGTNLRRRNNTRSLVKCVRIGCRPITHESSADLTETQEYTLDTEDVWRYENYRANPNTKMRKEKGERILKKIKERKKQKRRRYRKKMRIRKNRKTRRRRKEGQEWDDERKKTKKEEEIRVQDETKRERKRTRRRRTNRRT